MPTTATLPAPAPGHKRSALELDRDARFNMEQARQARRKVIEEQRNEVESAISLDREATPTEKQIRLYDDPLTGYSQRVRMAKRALAMTLAIWATYFFIWNADFWLATPDVAESLANKSMSLVTSVTGNSSGEAIAGASVTPVWLRVAIGCMLTTGFLALTAWTKSRTDETEQREELRELQPGQELTFRNIQRTIWTKRGLKAGYLVALAALLGYLYTYDVERARLMHDVQAMNQEAMEWEDLGIRISGGELETDEATGADGTAAAGAAGQDAGDSLAMAKPAVVVYSLLWMLHGILLLSPSAKAGEDRELAKFRRAAAARKADRLREREGQLLRSVLHRIHEEDGELRDALIREAQPVASRINQAAGRAAMDVPDSSEGQPGANTTASPISERSGSESGDDPGPPEDPGNTNHSPTDGDDDPYAAIFGRAA